MINNSSDKPTDETDDFDVTSLDENRFHSKTNSTPSSDNRFNFQNPKNPKQNTKQPYLNDNKTFLNNNFLSQIECLEKIIWNYKLENPIFNDKSITLPNEIIFKILL